MIDRIKVIKGNKVVRVTANELERYLSKGYVIKDGGKLSDEFTQPTLEKRPEYKSNPLYKTEPKIAETTDVAETKTDTTQVKKTQRKSRKK